MAVCSVVYLILAVLFNLDLFEHIQARVQATLVTLETFEADEFLVVLLLIIVALLIDLIRLRNRARREHELDQHRVQVMRSTMATVQDVVNNFLNNLQLFRFEAERSQALDADYLKLFDDLIEETAQKIKDIDDMETIAERQICEGLTSLEMKQAS